MKKIDLTGSKFGRWTVVSESGRNEHQKVMWKCVCQCGTEREVVAGDLRQGKSVSCGCYMIDVQTKHGHTKNKRTTGEFNSWFSAKKRCGNPNNPEYKNYGARGISMCSRWVNSFANFIADMGPRPDGNSIDRINVNGNYEPSNCRWADASTQSNNKRTCKPILYKGKLRTLNQWAVEFNIPKWTLRYRMGRGMGLDLAIKYLPQ